MEAKQPKLYSTVYYVAAVLNAYGIKNIIASPGVQNSMFNSIVQENSFFNTYSVIDERSAAYMATGLAEESGAPVVITCTEATASRNYLPALTEAFYRKLPVIALTFYNDNCTEFGLTPQHMDRSVTQNDIKSLCVNLPRISNDTDKKKCMTMLNAAMFTAVFKGEPVHINCPSCLDFSQNYSTELPENVWTCEFYDEDLDFDIEKIKDKKAAIFIGSHKRFKPEEEKAISEFAKSYSIPVICDHTANYYGENKISLSKLATMKLPQNRPELIIDIGNICGEYPFMHLFKNDIELWRISEDRSFRNRNNLILRKLFCCKEQNFFKKFVNKSDVKFDFYKELEAEIDGVKIPELPFSTPFVAQHLTKSLPQNSSLHLGILNSLRCTNFFNFNEKIDVNCNVGGFGIDGAVSTLVGQSLANQDKKVFGLVGDLAFFYDMNALGNNNIKNNVRILLANNNLGVEFRINPMLENRLFEKTDRIIAAKNHNPQGARGWAESCNFHYMSASNKDEYLSQLSDFCAKDFDKPVLFEVFTTTENEQKAMDLMKTYNNEK